MGYTTDFWGEFGLTPALTPEQRTYLTAFAETRRVRRDVTKLLPDPIREAVGLPPGIEGAYYVGDRDAGVLRIGQPNIAQENIIDNNEPPGQSGWDVKNESWDTYLERKQNEVRDGAQPGLWCQWVPNEDGTALVWDGGEKFYEYVEWIEYIITNFLKPWGIVANGQVEWQGEERDDHGVIDVKDNVVRVGHFEAIAPTFD
jgi:hypothetical protein